MNIFDFSLNVPMDAGVASRHYYPEGHVEVRQDKVLKEHVLNVYINNQLAARLVCTPVHLTELVLGRLLTEGCIASADDVSKITLSHGAERINVELTDECADAVKSRISRFSCMAKTFSLNENSQIELKAVTPLPWDASQIFHAVKMFEDDSPIHKITNCVHSCYLFENDSVKYCCEDIGRHNAFDKVVGCALCDGVDLRNTFVFTSGRVPLDMVTKAIRAGIPMLVSKAAPTEQTVQMAQTYGLTLVGLAHADSFCVYTNMPIMQV